MHSDHSLLFVNSAIMIFATTICVILFSGSLDVGLVLFWSLAAFAFGLATSAWHHKRVHRTFLADASILSMAGALGVLAGSIAFLTAASVYSAFSSLNTRFVFVTSVLFTSFVGSVVVGGVATFKREPHGRLLRYAGIAAVIITIVSCIALQVFVSSEANKQYDRFEESRGEMLRMYSDLSEARASLEGTTVLSAFDSARESLAAELRAFELSRDCDRIPTPIDACIDSITDPIVFTVDMVIRNLLLSNVTQDAANTIPVAGASLTTYEVDSIMRPQYAEPVRLESLSAKESVRLAIGESSSAGGPASGQFEMLTGGVGLEASLRTLVLSTQAGDEVAQLIIRVQDRVTYYQARGPLIGLALLLEADPSLADDPLFATLARERLNSSD